MEDATLPFQIGQDCFVMSLSDNSSYFFILPSSGFVLALSQSAQAAASFLLGLETKPDKQSWLSLPGHP